MVQGVKAFLKAIWAIWALVLFCATLLIVTPVYALLFLTRGKKGFWTAHRLSRIWSKVLFGGFLINWQVKGRDQLDPEKPYVMVANHRSQLDIPAFALAARHPFKFLAKAELTKIPLLGYIIKHLYLTVKRQSLRGRAESMKKMQEALDEGISVVIFPEGSRNRTDNPVKGFYDGAFQLAVQAQTDVAVLVIEGTDRLLPAGELLQFSPGKIRCTWVKVIPTQGMTETDVPALKAEAKAAMEAQLTKFSDKP